MTRSILPEKEYFKLAEVSKLLELGSYMLPYLEKEFDMFRPSRTRARQRLYHRSEVERLLEIVRLMFDEKYTSGEAKQVLQKMEHQRKSKGRVRCTGNEINSKQHRSTDQAALSSTARKEEDVESLLADVREDLKELLEMLKIARPS